MEERVGRFAGILGALALIGYVGVAGGVVDILLPETPSDEAAVPATPFLSSPLQCDARMWDGMTSVTMSAPRCYQRKTLQQLQGFKEPH